MNTTLADLDLIVLCGGRGVRLRPATDHLPKALVPVAGRPIIEHVVGFLTAQGITRLHLCIGYKGEMIRRHFEGIGGGLDIRFSDIGEEASMLQRLLAAAAAAGPRMLVAYCDTFIDIRVADILAHHQDRNALATIVTAPIRNPFGIVTFTADSVVTSFREKPVNHHFIGLSLLDRATFELVDDTLLAMPDGSGLIELFQRLIAAGRLHAFEHDGLNITFNTLSERAEAHQSLSHYYTLAEEGQTSPATKLTKDLRCRA